MIVETFETALPAPESFAHHIHCPWPAGTCPCPPAVVRAL